MMRVFANRRLGTPLPAVLAASVSRAQCRCAGTDTAKTVAKDAPVTAASAAAPSKAATSAAGQAKAPGVTKFKHNFPKFLGDRMWEQHAIGDHFTVYVDTHMFGWIVMNRTGSSANALNETVLRGIEAAFQQTDKLFEARKIKVAILTSAKETFCVGADLDMMYPVTDPKLGVEASRAGHAVFQKIENSPYPVVAAVNGLALGGGCELALACHHRVAADSASMGLPETMLGLLPGAGGCVRLQRLIGLQKALEWILKGSPNRADKCKKVGAVDAVVEAADRLPGEHRFFESVRAWAGKLVDRPLRPSRGKTKSLLNRALEDTSIGQSIVLKESLKRLNKQTRGKYQGHYAALECVMYSAIHGVGEKAYQHEAQRFADMLVTPEAKNQCSLYFLDDGMKRVEAKTGIPADKIPKVGRIGVLGAGVMGSGIAHYFVKKGHEVGLKDISDDAVRKGVDFIRTEFEGDVKKKRMDKKGLQKKLAMITGGTGNDVFKGTDVIVEAAVEVMDIKKKMLQAMEADGTLDGKRIFATNTSSLSLTELQTVSKHPHNVVGMHFFNPVKMMPLVEVIKGKQTSAEAAAVIYNLALKCGKKPIIVNDGPGFLVNRVLGVYMAESARLVVDDHACPMRVDKVIKDFGMPMGPFRLLDEVGLDVACHVAPVLENGLKSKRFAVPAAVGELVEAGFLGKKVRKGIYRYEPDSGKELGMNSTIAEKYLTAKPDTRFAVADIVDRCTLIMVNEAAMILAEGIAATPEDVDIGMVFGTGFAPFRGGLMQYADHRGVDKVVDRLQRLRDSTKDDRFAPAPLLVDMSKANKQFFPSRPFLPYVERTGYPKVNPW